ncbi:hypothetical protein [Noviherbaspirillum pedocola]|uniref:Uncharacterized protein n=1 Tax=Noviherbaspirillum pedocola TaxID=2801341 RepID=A0A934W934_9BURK|nr:hypothetical protein [Noviherbaspirillum pedocola]MBK4739377.1 hypothetical protein [Noviherbaspirillum pedocola]
MSASWLQLARLDVGKRLQHGKVKFFQGLLVCRSLRPIPVGKRCFAERDDIGLAVGEYRIRCFGLPPASLCLLDSTQ